jgi:hypothetical protein
MKGGEDFGEATLPALSGSGALPALWRSWPTGRHLVRPQGALPGVQRDGRVPAVPG